MSNYSKEDIEYLRSVGARIRALRKEQNISQEKFATLAKIDRAYIGAIERGERNISRLNLRKITEALGCRPNDVLDFMLVNST
jgi:transcriptional regulator with XRE-family HTH domain